jgi:hypothetical protein
MAQSSRRSTRYPYQTSLRRHVLSPIERATKRVDQEKAEVAAEREAFEAFGDRVSDLTLVANTGCSKLHRPVASQSGHIEQVREAYRATVMSTEHYCSEYGDSCIESLRGEFGPNIAAALSPENPVPFTHVVKKRVLAAASCCANARNDLFEHAEAESTSLSQAREELTDIVGRLGASQFPVQHESPLMSRLEGIAVVRQNVLRQHAVPGSMDEVEFCEFLYANEPWTFPVLVAVGRLREAAVEC